MKRQKWTNYDRAILIAHHRKFGMTNREDLYKKLPHRTIGSIKCEIQRFNNWILYDVMEQHYKNKPNFNISIRTKTRQTYIKIIKDLNL